LNRGNSSATHHANVTSLSADWQDNPWNYVTR